MRPGCGSLSRSCANWRAVGEALAPRPRPEDKRVWASLKQGAAEVIKQAFDEASRRDPKHTKHWVALADGNPKQLFYLRQTAKKYGVKLVIILDLIHVLEYLWSAAWALHRTADPQAEDWVSQRLLEILRGRSSLVAAGMRQQRYLALLKRERTRPAR